MEKLAAKDLTFRIDQPLPEAYSKLKDDFNAAIGVFDEVIRKLSASTSAITTGTMEISSASDDLAKRTEVQAANLEETAAAVAEITAKVRQTAQGAGQARDVVASAREEAAKSGEVVRQAIEAMQHIESSSQQITQIIGVIDEIAFQTNLLALNAGWRRRARGMPARASRWWRRRCGPWPNAQPRQPRKSRPLIASSHSQVQHGVQLVGLTGQTLERIVARVVEINQVVHDIAMVAGEQAAACSR